MPNNETPRRFKWQPDCYSEKMIDSACFERRCPLTACSKRVSARIQASSEPKRDIPSNEADK